MFAKFAGLAAKCGILHPFQTLMLIWFNLVDFFIDRSQKPVILLWFARTTAVGGLNTGAEPTGFIRRRLQVDPVTWTGGSCVEHLTCKWSCNQPSTSLSSLLFTTANQLSTTYLKWNHCPPPFSLSSSEKQFSCSKGNFPPDLTKRRKEHRDNTLVLLWLIFLPHFLFSFSSGFIKDAHMHTHARAPTAEFQLPLSPAASHFQLK